MYTSTLKENYEESCKEGISEEVKCRRYIHIFFAIIFILIGLPSWWYTTRVYRASLPLEQMQDINLINTTNCKSGMPLSLEYDFLISFVHPDPLNPKVALKGEDIEENLRPYLDTISSVFEFVVKSQWLHIGDLGVAPTKYTDHYALRKAQLPLIITPLETKLWTHLSTRPTINFIIYFQPCNHLPLYIFDEKNKKVDSNAFMSPRWGGIYIINPDKQSCQYGIFKPNLQSIVSIFLSQIHKLFEIDIFDSDNIYKFKISKSTEMVESTRRTLKSLAHLLSEIERIVISDEVAEKINIALESANLAAELLRKGDVDKSLDLAKVSFKNSEEVFGEASLMALLYFPEEDKKNVYMPLFLPLLLELFFPFVTSMITVLLTLRTLIGKKNKNNKIEYK